MNSGPTGLRILSRRIVSMAAISRTDAQAMNFVQADLLYCRSDADARRPFVCAIQMALLFHLQNHPREILLRPFV